MEIRTKRINAETGDITLGCKWAIRGGRLVALDKDPFHDRTAYYYIKPATTVNAFVADVRDAALEEASESTLKDATATFQLVYIPTLRRGNRMMVLNTIDDEFTLKKVFSYGTISPSLFENCQLEPMKDGCIDPQKVAIRPINLTTREVNYLISYYGLGGSDDMEVVFIPLYMAAIGDKNAIQIANGSPQSMRHDFTPDRGIMGTLLLQILGFVLSYAVTWTIMFRTYNDWLPAYLEFGSKFMHSSDYFYQISPLLAIIDVLLTFTKSTLVLFLMATLIPAFALVVPFLIAKGFNIITAYAYEFFLKTRKKKTWANMKKIIR